MSADVDTGRSTSGYVMTHAREVVSWLSRLQKAMETEYIAVVEANEEVIWMKEFIGELGIQKEEF